MAIKLVRLKSYPGSPGVTLGRVRMRKYKGRILVYRQAYRHGRADYGSVNGFKASEPFLEKGVAVMKVEPVSDEEKDEIRKVLKNVLQGSISFWPQ